MGEWRGRFQVCCKPFEGTNERMPSHGGGEGRCRLNITQLSRTEMMGMNLDFAIVYVLAAQRA